MEAHRYFVIYKPFDMVSQFVSPDKVNLLCDLDYPFPEGTHAVGRLDNHSEGLLLLTTNKKVTRLLFQSEVPHRRTYLVKVKGAMSGETLQRLRHGVPIRIDGGEEYVTTPCHIEITQKPVTIAERSFELPANAPHTWLLITLTEGKYHQVRKMVGAVKHRCQRLIRVSIEDMTLGNLQPGEVREVPEQEFFELLKITGY
ncbi:pseudouridine synthase [Chitinophaga solisilvae]|uniref:Pseudouridine synthase n=1 Tax=Chitinophaga solisilvae TaxID=1233460 RepID=A0A3S1DS08_9BACT|nr:pseudouridine synthase [Chitinophaga solisilvae]NSL86332.1 rRNA pseudouridine synthase [Chitinophaga solisilvae]